MADMICQQMMIQLLACFQIFMDEKYKYSAVLAKLCELCEARQIKQFQLLPTRLW